MRIMPTIAEAMAKAERLMKMTPEQVERLEDQRREAENAKHYTADYDEEC